MKYYSNSDNKKIDRIMIITIITIIIQIIIITITIILILKAIAIILKIQIIIISLTSFLPWWQLQHYPQPPYLRHYKHVQMQKKCKWKINKMKNQIDTGQDGCVRKNNFKKLKE